MAEVNGDTSASQTNGHTGSSPPTQQTVSTVAATTAAASSQTAATSTEKSALNPSVPLTSLQNSASDKRPRDARLIHMLLSSLGVTAYQERVPLQILDFAYRHASGILSDALHLSSDAYQSQQSRARDGPSGSSLKDADGQTSMTAIQLAIQSRLQYQFSGGNAGGLSKEFLLETAESRNKIALPRVTAVEWGIRLPNEKFVLTGIPWGLKEAWEPEDDEDEEVAAPAADADGDVKMGSEIPPEESGEGPEGGTAEDLFGEDFDDAMEE